MKPTFTWSLQWQIFTAMVVVLIATLLLFTWIIGNLFLTAWDRQLTTRLTLLAQLAQNNLPLGRMAQYVPGDENTIWFKQDIKQLTEFAQTYQLDHISILSREGRVHMDSAGLLPGTATGYGSLITQNPIGTLTRLHRNRQGQWQKIMLLSLNNNQLLLLAAGSEMFTVLERVNARRNLTLLFGILLSLCLSWAISYFLGKKFSRLTQAFRSLQAGNQSTRVPAQGSDEIAFLSRAFNDMAKELELKTKQEREQHEKRISELKVLSAGVAHEIRNPLGAISGLADLLAREQTIKSTPDSQDLVDRIRQEIDRMDSIIKEVMAYARQPNLNLCSIDLASLVQDITKIDQTCQISLPDPVPAVRADYTGLLTVIRNLLINAREAAGPKGRVTLEIQANAGKVYFRVSDNGPGIPPDQAEKIFQPFFSKKPQGTGLGLAIARNIMEAHKGQLKLVNTEIGSLFIAELPLLEEV